MEVAQHPVQHVPGASRLSTADEMARLASLLGLMIQGQKYRGVTMRAVAKMRGSHGPNLSVFISSGGRTRNINAALLQRMLHDLGLHPDGLLTPGFHRWDLTGHLGEQDRVDLDSLLALVQVNSRQSASPVCVSVMWQGGLPESAICFVLLRPAEGTLLMVRMAEADAIRLVASSASSIRLIYISDGEGAELQSAWQAEDHEWIVAKKIETYINQSGENPGKEA
ncbi:hypothetical protein ACW0US_17850 [Xanthomonas euvesicatoria]